MNATTKIIGQSDVLDCYGAMHNCKKCGGRPKTMTVGGLGRPMHFWVCSVCGSHGKSSASYANAYDQWQKFNATAQENQNDSK